ncbi:MAG TPA: formaldehyde-activating enzyme [Acidimicrobiales bacterium]|nr:formaldehyde-activating enzyme [Acidimicrobiales bacterium]
MLIGESFQGEGVNAAHINVVLGERNGPVGTAWATALATPSAGHAPFVVVAQPGVPSVPPTLFVNKAAIGGPAHANLTWGAAQAGVAAGVGQALEQSLIEGHDTANLVLIAAVWVNPGADDDARVFANNREATLEALRRAVEGRPSVGEFLAAAKSPFNPFFRPS